jgi:hypothetical protein
MKELTELRRQISQGHDAETIAQTEYLRMLKEDIPALITEATIGFKRKLSENCTIANQDKDKTRRGLLESVARQLGFGPQLNPSLN